MAEHKHEEDHLHRLRHSASHVMAQAVLEEFPDGKVAIGPPIEKGFYYDFELPRPLTPEDLEEIEARMREIVAEGHDFVYKEVSEEEARQLFADQPYKLELIDGLEAGGTDEDGNPLAEKPVISTYTQDTFEDLCRGPHLEHTGQIPPDGFKLMNVAGAYWRGDENRPMLQRIYGTAWPSKRELKGYLLMLEEAKKRDHRRLGKDLDLFSIDETIGGGLVLWHPKGGFIRKQIEDYWRDEHMRGGYDIVYSPHIAKLDLWNTSGHTEYYKENMYSPIDIETVKYQLKPMNCPFHIAIYNTRKRSYREFPIRWCELGTVYRYEKTGALHGLMRLRGFTQDDAHIFCRFDQLEDEVAGVLDLALFMVDTFGFKNYSVYLSTRPEKYAGDLKLWEQATDTLAKALARQKLAYEIDPGEGVFYGPKIDLKMLDALGREWQLSTIQFDFNLPRRFGVDYVTPEGDRQNVYMVHRAIYGSLERFVGMLIEHYAGVFPVWLAPVQAVVLPVGPDFLGYAREVENDLRQRGIRVRVDAREEKVGRKIRDAELEKIPTMLVVGAREEEAGSVNVRRHGGGEQVPRPVEEFARELLDEITQRG